MSDSFEIFPVGVIRKQKGIVTIEIYEKDKDALMGLDQFSHIMVCSWFHENDTPEKRSRLQVHPRRNETNPLTGIFACRSPVRPNPIAISTCKILSIDENIIHIDTIDSFDGTRVIDIKPCMSKNDLTLEVKVPEWAEE